MSSALSSCGITFTFEDGMLFGTNSHGTIWNHWEIEEELKVLLHSMGQNPSEHELQEMQ